MEVSRKIISSNSALNCRSAYGGPWAHGPMGPMGAVQALLLADLIHFSTLFRPDPLTGPANWPKLLKSPYWPRKLAQIDRHDPLIGPVNWPKLLKSPYWLCKLAQIAQRDPLNGPAN